MNYITSLEGCHHTFPRFRCTNTWFGSRLLMDNYFGPDYVQNDLVLMYHTQKKIFFFKKCLLESEGHASQTELKTKPFPHPQDEDVWCEICSDTEWTQSVIKTGRCQTQKRKKTKEVKLALCNYGQKPTEAGRGKKAHDNKKYIKSKFCVRGFEGKMV